MLSSKAQATKTNLRVGPVAPSEQDLGNLASNGKIELFRV